MSARQSLGHEGRTVNELFEDEVWAEMLICHVVKEIDLTEENPDNQIKDVARLLFNVCYSYEIVKLSAKEVKSRLQWLDIKEVQKLKFSDKWCTNFIRRRKFGRRRITREKKDIPSQREARKFMKLGQDVIIEGGYTAYRVLNLDETSIKFGIGPMHVCAHLSLL